MLKKLIIILLNKLLGANPGIQTKLSQWQGKVIGLEFIGFSLILQIKSGAKVALVRAPTDALIIFPLNISRYLTSLDKLDLARALSFAGDKELAFNFLNLLTKLHLNILYGKNPILDQILYRSEQLVQLIKAQLVDQLSNYMHSTIEYLQYESLDLITLKDLNNFHNEVYEVNSKVQRIASKIDLYNQITNNNQTK